MNTMINVILHNAFVVLIMTATVPKLEIIY